MCWLHEFQCHLGWEALVSERREHLLSETSCVCRSPHLDWDLLSSLLALQTPLQTPLHQVFLRLVEHSWASFVSWLVPFRVGCRKLCQVLLQILGLRPQNPILFSDFGSCNCWSLMIQTLMKRHRCRLCHTQRAFELTCSCSAFWMAFRVQKVEE